MSQDTIYFFWDCLQYLINGIAQGSLYAIVALGYTMVYGIIRLVNFAHGEFLMLGAFCGYFALRFQLPMPVAILASMLGAGIVALIVERFLYRPIRGEGRIPALITAIGASLFFQYTGQLAFGADPKTIPPVFTEVIYNFGEINVSNIQIFIFGLTLFILLFLWWLTHFTKIGVAMRATSYNLKAAELMGINTNRIIAFTFFLGAALAGLAGILMGYTMSIEPMMGMSLGLKAFVAAVVGGIGIIPGAALGGFIIGIAENMVAGLYKSSFRDGVSFFILIIILLIKPSGILGKNVKEKV
ncbi:branched-chain amino acid ABC transporter permease [Bacteriovorax sp. PP10]|uniref:Branched-chain amino acid ABC transporter permease n=1 Tax=Bacteriovorax antarcticus TaxID=3088717 RepID=A0ABU5VYS9_9BACT|nr:branched-chain amino acid ABC transporter permease [Bacteriovorax sp. PP10]MEA9358218.1 branched-chain amino acid ABC transporter permease [Bacteriovorax sp. PP10]